MESLRLSVVRLRLTRWGEAVNILEDPTLGQLEPDPDEVEVAKTILVKITTLFESSTSMIANESVEDLAPTNMKQPVHGLLTILEDIASERSKTTNFPKPRKSTLSKKSIADLAEKSANYINELEEYFPAARRQRDLWESEMLSIVGKHPLEDLENAAIGIDPWMSTIRRPKNNLIDRSGYFVGQNAGYFVGNNCSSISSTFMLPRTE